MSRRKENVRKALAEIDEFVDAVNTQIKNGNLQLAIFTLSGIKVRTHRIKRTTWRGEKDGHRPELRLACTCKVCVPNVKKHDGETIGHKKLWKEYDDNLAKQLGYKWLNTNQTTTANIDVSTIPYY